jgi:hypothetical protein
MRVDPGNIRRRLNTHLARSSRGEMVKLARELGLSAGTISKFSAGTYSGNNGRLAGLLAEALENRDAAAAIASGSLRLSWLINTRKGLRLIKKRTTFREIRAQFPDAYVVQVWRGTEPREIHFVRHEIAEDGGQ